MMAEILSSSPQTRLLDDRSTAFLIMPATLSNACAAAAAVAAMAAVLSMRLRRGRTLDAIASRVRAPVWRVRFRKTRPRGDDQHRSACRGDEATAPAPFWTAPKPEELLSIPPVAIFKTHAAIFRGHLLSTLDNQEPPTQTGTKFSRPGRVTYCWETNTARTATTRRVGSEVEVTRVGTPRRTSRGRDHTRCGDDHTGPEGPSPIGTAPAFRIHHQRGCPGCSQRPPRPPRPPCQ